MNFVADLRFKFCGLPSCLLLTYGCGTKPTTEMWKKEELESKSGHAQEYR